MYCTYEPVDAVFEVKQICLASALIQCRWPRIGNFRPQKIGSETTRAVSGQFHPVCSIGINCGDRPGVESHVNKVLRDVNYEKEMLREYRYTQRNEKK